MEKLERRGPVRRKSRYGGSALEMALLMPWYVFLFVGAFDWGFFAHALISTESAARVAALYASQNTSTAVDSTTACTYAKEELAIAPNIGSTTTCPSSSLPLIVTAQKVTGTNSADGNDAAQVTVTYQTVGVIPIPGLLQRQPTFVRIVQMRLRS